MFKLEKESDALSERAPSGSLTSNIKDSTCLVMRDPNPDVNQPPPDNENKAPVKIPPDQPGLPPDDQPDPPPEGDPPSHEPTRLAAKRLYAINQWVTFSFSFDRARPVR
jgi:hypothetical protein